MIDCISDLHVAVKKTKQVEVTQSLYWYFLEVLPPREFTSESFVFQEGDGLAERLKFEKFLGKYYCKLLQDTLTTSDYKLWVHVKRINTFDDDISRFKIVYLWSDGDDDRLADEYREFMGKEFPNVSDIEEAMGLSFLP